MLWGLQPDFLWVLYPFSQEINQNKDIGNYKRTDNEHQYRFQWALSIELRLNNCGNYDYRGEGNLISIIIKVWE